MENEILQSLAGKENINLLDYYFLANHLPNMNIHHFHIDYNAPCLNFSCDGCKGQYTRGVLLPEHDPGSFCMCQYTRGSVFKFALFAPGACSQTFNRLNIVEHFAGWKFCSRGWSIPMKSLVHTEELCSRSVPLEHDPGAKSLVYIGLNTQEKLPNSGYAKFWGVNKVHCGLCESSEL